jgi:hypothetical protein
MPGKTSSATVLKRVCVAALKRAAGPMSSIATPSSTAQCLRMMRAAIRMTELMLIGCCAVGCAGGNPVKPGSLLTRRRGRPSSTRPCASGWTDPAQDLVGDSQADGQGGHTECDQLFQRDPDPESEEIAARQPCLDCSNDASTHRTHERSVPCLYAEGGVRPTFGTIRWLYRWRSSSVVEQGTHKPFVGGSNPPSATSLHSDCIVAFSGHIVEGPGLPGDCEAYRFVIPSTQVVYQAAL